MINVDAKSLYWIAGLLEGEGCFATCSYSSSPSITLKMTDLDVVKNAHEVMQATTKICWENGPRRTKLLYGFRMRGELVAEWMLLLLPLMGSRRQAKIKDCLRIWARRPVRKLRNFGVPSKLSNGTQNPEYSRLWHLVRKADADRQMEAAA